MWLSVWREWELSLTPAASTVDVIAIAIRSKLVKCFLQLPHPSHW
jgi:hypothetical protein